MVWPDRTPHPAAFELKHLQAPLAISLPPSAAAADAAGEGQEVQLVLRNKQHFSSSASLALSWRLLADGLPVADGSKEGWRSLILKQALRPQEEATVGLGAIWAELAQQVQQAAEPCLEVRAQVRVAAGTADAGAGGLADGLCCLQSLTRS